MKLVAGHFQSKNEARFSMFPVSSRHTLATYQIWTIYLIGLRMSKAQSKNRIGGNQLAVATEVLPDTCRLLPIFISDVPAFTVERCSSSQAQSCGSESLYLSKESTSRHLLSLRAVKFLHDPVQASCKPILIVKVCLKAVTNSYMTLCGHHANLSWVWIRRSNCNIWNSKLIGLVCTWMNILIAQLQQQQDTGELPSTWEQVLLRLISSLWASALVLVLPKPQIE